MNFLVIVFACIVAGLVPVQGVMSHDFELGGASPVIFTHLEFGQAQFLDQDSKPVTVPFSSLSRSDKLAVMELSGWGRVWKSRCGQYSTFADQVSCSKTSVTLETESGQTIVVDLAHLSDEDRAYVLGAQRSSAKAMPPTACVKVVKVSAGESFTVLHNFRQYRVTVDGIDAPENGQDFHKEAKDKLSDLVLGHVVKCVRKSTDHQGMNHCMVTIDGDDLGDQMVQSGLAWVAVADRNSDSGRMRLEKLAFQGKDNIWSHPTPVAPWDWHKWSFETRREYQQIARIAAERALEHEPVARLAATGVTTARGSRDVIGVDRGRPELIPFSRTLTWHPSYIDLDGHLVVGKWIVVLERNATTRTRQANYPAYRTTFTNSFTTLPSLRNNGPVHVRGYYRKDGTYVRPHTRSRPSR